MKYKIHLSYNSNKEEWNNKFSVGSTNILYWTSLEDLGDFVDYKVQSPLEVLRKSFRDPSEILRKSSGSPLEVLQKSSRSPSEVLWKSFGSPLEVRWKSFGLLGQKYFHSTTTLHTLTEWGKFSDKMGLYTSHPLWASFTVVLVFTCLIIYLVSSSQLALFCWDLVKIFILCKWIRTEPHKKGKFTILWAESEISFSISVSYE